MLSDIFYWMINISILGSVAGIIVLILRQIKVIPRRIIYLLWFIPLLRFYFPFGIANRYSLLGILSEFTTKTVLINENSLNFTASNFIMAADSYFPITYKTDLLRQIFYVASFIWLAIAAALMITAIALYFITKSEISKSRLIRDNIYASDSIMAPAVYGILKPKIVVPSSMENQDMKYILLHENVHIRRRDNLWRVLAIFTACLHWFNPLAWIFVKKLFEDMEVSCDAKVVGDLTKDESKDYSMAVLQAASDKTLYSSAFGGARVKIRIENILSYKKLTIGSTLFLIGFILIIAIVVMTNAPL